MFGESVSMGMFSGTLNKKRLIEIMYCNIQTLSKDENLCLFKQEHFEAIIYDEAHHVSAASYKKVMDYFKPQFTLGMTATPDKEMTI